MNDVNTLLEPLSGYAREMAEAILAAFPEWAAFAQAENNPRFAENHPRFNEIILHITVPDPVAERGQDMLLFADYEEGYFTFSGVSAHWHMKKWKTENDAQHFAGMVAWIKGWLDEKDLYTQPYKNGVAAGFGGFYEANPEGVERALQQTRDGNEELHRRLASGTLSASREEWVKQRISDELRFYSWQGTHDKIVHLSESEPAA